MFQESGFRRVRDEMAWRLYWKRDCCNTTPKSLANLAEASWLGCLVPVAALVRVIFGQKIKRERIALVAIVSLCLAAFLVYANQE